MFKKEIISKVKTIPDNITTIKDIVSVFHQLHFGELHQSSSGVDPKIYKIILMVVKALLFLRTESSSALLAII